LAVIGIVLLAADIVPLPSILTYVLKYKPYPINSAITITGCQAKFVSSPFNTDQNTLNQMEKSLDGYFFDDLIGFNREISNFLIISDYGEYIIIRISLISTRNEEKSY
jgi:hypothetical protein